jgi:hypothetical protein
MFRGSEKFLLHFVAGRSQHDSQYLRSPVAEVGIFPIYRHLSHFFTRACGDRRDDLADQMLNTLDVGSPALSDTTLSPPRQAPRPPLTCEFHQMVERFVAFSKQLPWDARWSHSISESGSFVPRDYNARLLATRQ